MSYYEKYKTGYFGFYHEVAVNTENLLIYGDGRCGAWARFLADVIKTQGLQYGNWLIDLKPDPSYAQGILVKNWAFVGVGTSENLLYPYKNIINCDPSTNPDRDFVGENLYNFYLPEVQDVTGVAGQSTANPHSAFRNHAVLKLPFDASGNTVPSGCYFDPSYGNTYASIPEIDSGAIDGYWAQYFAMVDETIPLIDLDGNGLISSYAEADVLLIRPNDDGVVTDLWFGEDPY